ncbi:transcription repressor NadR [Virgibacillus halodenitrificans]|uniref:transcription repressor NadR n=1 Tax=Virgibacillus halodenitrificans TaxID=1482 RepID=UPI001F40D1C5|nr:transcription repressor NadR [Virgibacillus halodenitrificans]MCG1027668.1 transcription repressor NadR [Virgibacillus halodenitrificans]
MNEEQKMSSIKRQNLIMKLLRDAEEPITGSEFAKQTNVSRQVIVQDVSILKAKKEPIMATSQGYVLLDKQKSQGLLERIVVCKHAPEQTQEELNIFVDHGVKVKDVIVEHAVYGDLTASVMVSNRAEANRFIERIQETNAVYLSSLTNGIHLHTLEADTQEKLDAACDALKKAGILVE